MWPALIKNVTDACVEYNSKLVFFDNVYAIGGDHVNHITENSPISPTSKKGEVRAAVDKIILDGIEKGKLNAIIARSADFFSAVKDKSMLMNLCLFLKLRATRIPRKRDHVADVGHARDK
jgi:UDP-glucose 4-epimerase